MCRQIYMRCADRRDINAYLESIKQIVNAIYYLRIGGWWKIHFNCRLPDSKMIFEDQFQARAENRHAGQGSWLRSLSRRTFGEESKASLLIGLSIFWHEKAQAVVADTLATNNILVIWWQPHLRRNWHCLFWCSQGSQDQTRRHTYLCHLLGIKNIVLAVNKMDLINYDQSRFDAIVWTTPNLQAALVLVHSPTPQFRFQRW